MVANTQPRNRFQEPRDSACSVVMRVITPARVDGDQLWVRARKQDVSSVLQHSIDHTKVTKGVATVPEDAPHD
jgi:hypothetical protein